MKATLFTGIAAMSLMAGLAATPAFAQSDEEQIQALLDGFKNLMALGGYELGFKDIDVNNERLMVNNARVRITSFDNLPEEADIPFDFTKPFTLPQPLIFEDAGPHEDGEAALSRLYMPGFEIELEEATFSVGEIAYEGVRIPISGDADFLDLLIMTAGSTIGASQMFIDGAHALDLEPITSTAVFTPSQTRDVEKIDYTFDMPGLNFLASNAPEGVIDPMFAVIIGSEDLHMSGSGEMSWTIADGRITYESWQFTADNVGRISMSFDMSGFTPEVMEQLMELSQSLDPESEEGQQAMMEWGMGVLARSQFYSMAIKYEDLGVAARMLPLAFQEEDLTPKEAVDEMFEDGEEFFEAIDNPEFEAMIRGQLEEFFTDPQSLEIRVQPETPLPAISFLGLIATPKVLIDTLGVTLVANEG